MKADHVQRQAKYIKETKPQVSKSASPADLLNNACSKIEDKPQIMIASDKVEGKQVEEIKPVTPEAVPYDWETDSRTQILKQENQRLNSQIQQANKKINGLADEVDELREPAKLCRQIKSYLQGESPQDWKGLVKMSGGKDW